MRTHQLSPNEYNEQTLAEEMLDADILLNHLILSPALLGLGRRTKRPTVVFSTDDYTQKVHPLSPIFASLGTELPDGTPVTIDDDVFVNGRKVWEIGKMYGKVRFDPNANLMRRLVLETATREADGVVVTCEPLAEVQRALGQKNVFVFPNYIDPREYPQIDLTDHDEVRLLWQGGDSHFIDWHKAGEIVRRAIVKHPNVKLYLFGLTFDTIVKRLPRARFEFIDWVDYHAFPLRLATIAPDINLCPLVRNDFNECKSAIKFYEAAAISRPAATIAANVGPYAREILDGETGLLYNDLNEFALALDRLIEDAVERKRLAQNAKDWVHENRTISVKHVVPFHDWLQATHADSCARRGQPRRRQRGVVDPYAEDTSKLPVSDDPLA